MHAVLYRDAAELLCNDAATLLSADDWAARPELHARLEQYWRRAYVGTLIVRQLAPEGDLPLDDEQLGTLLHDRLQNAPPLHDQLARVGACCLIACSKLAWIQYAWWSSSVYDLEMAWLNQVFCPMPQGLGGSVCAFAGVQQHKLCM